MLNWKNNRILRIFVRSVSSVLIAAFLSYDLVWAGASEVLSFAGRNNLSLAPAIAIPPELGTIKESYLSGPNPQNLVVYIQDAHANKEVQENEVKIITYLQDTYKINLVSAEGGFGDFDAGFFRGFPQDKVIRNKIAKYFLDKSFISAVDYLLITRDNPPRVYGAEDKAVYDTHLNAFRKNQAICDSFKKSLRDIEGLLETLKEKHYSRDLRELDQKIDDFREGRLSLEGFISHLRLASIIERFSLVSFPNLSTLINLQKLERQIDFEKAEGQRQSLIDRLTKTLPKAKLEELLRQSLDFKSGQLSPAKYYAYLEKASQTAAINRQGYPHLFTYIRYLALSESLDNEKILEESGALAERLREDLTVTVLQKDIDSLNNICRILKRLSDIELSPREYEYFKKQRQEFSQENLRNIIERCASSPFAGTLPADQDIKSLERFYSLAYDRDKAIVANSLNRLKSEYGARAVILVAGGFHTQGITSLLKENGVSYMVVAPKITPKQERQELYFSLLNEKKLNLDDILSGSDTLQIINSISDPQARRLFISYWITRASRYYSPEDLKAQLDRLALSVDDQKAVALALHESASASHGTSESAPENGKDVKRRGQFDTPGASAPILEKKEFSLKKSIIAFTLSLVILASTFWNDVFGAGNKPQAPKEQTVATQIESKTNQVSAKEEELLKQKKALIEDYERKEQKVIFSDDEGNFSPGYDAHWPEKPSNLSAEINRVGRDAYIENLKNEVNQKLTVIDSQIKPQFKSPLSDNTKTLQETLNKKEQLIQKLEQETQLKQKELQDALVKIRSQEQKANEGIAAVQKELKAAKSESLQGKTAIEKLSSEQKETQHKIISLEETNKALKNEALNLKDMLSKAQERIFETEKEVSNITNVKKSWWENSGNGWKIMYSLLAVMGIATAVLSFSIHRKRSKLKQLKDEIIQKEKERERVVGELAVLKESIENLHGQVRQAEVLLAQSEGKRQAMDGEIKKASDESNRLKEEISTLQNAHTLLIEEREFILKASLDDEKQKRLIQIKDETGILLKQKEGLLYELETLRKDINIKNEALHLAVSESESRVSVLKGIIGQLEKEQKQYEETVANLRKEADGYAVVMAGLEEKKSAALQEQLVMKDALNAKERLEEINISITKAKENQAQLKEDMRILEDKNKEYESRLSAYQEQKAKLETETDSLLRQSKDLSETIRELNIQKEALINEEAGLRRNIEDKSSALKDLERKIISLKLADTQGEEQIDSFKKQKRDLEGEIAKLSQYVSGLSTESAAAKMQFSDLQASLSNLKEQRRFPAESIEGLEDNKTVLTGEINRLTDQKNEINAEIAALRQDLSGINLRTDAKIDNLNKDIKQKQIVLDDLTAKISDFTAKKVKLEQEIVEIINKKSKEMQELKQAVQEKEDVDAKTQFANQQRERADTQLGNLLNSLDELKQRGVNLNQEIPAITLKRDLLQEELKELGRLKLGLEESIRQLKSEAQETRQELPSIALPQPYPTMIFDVDNTLTDTTTEIDKELLAEILDFLRQNVRIALVTAQSIDEVKEHIIRSVPQEQAYLLKNLTIYPSAGAKCYRFNESGELIGSAVYDVSANTVLMNNQQEVEEALRKTVGRQVVIHFRDGLVTITGLSNREEALGRLITLFKEEGWHYLPRVAGRSTIHILVGGSDKAKAAVHFVKEIAENEFRQEIPPEQVLVVGDSFYAGGLDADILGALPEARVISVGKKPKGRQLKEFKARGLIFSEDLVGTTNWQATLRLLKEIKKGKGIINTKNDNGGSLGIANVFLSFILVVSAGFFSFFPAAISNAQGYRTEYVDKRTEEKIKQLIDDLRYEAKEEKTKKKLVKFGAVAVEYLLKELAKEYGHEYPRHNFDRLRGHSLDIIHSIGKDAERRLFSIAQDDSRDIYLSLSAVRLLSGFNNQDSVDILSRILMTDKRKAQTSRMGWRSAMTEAAESLIHSRNGSSFLALYNAFINGDETVRMVSVNAFLDSGDKNTEWLVDSLFTDNSYRNRITAINNMIKIISERGIKNTKIINALHWLLTSAKLPDGRFYPDTTRMAALALLNAGYDESRILAESIKERGLLDRPAVMECVLNAIGENKKPWSPVLDSLEWLVFEGSTGRDEKYLESIAKPAVKTLLKLGDPGIERLKSGLDNKNYDYPLSIIIEVLAEMKINNSELSRRLYDKMFGIWNQDKANLAARALYQLEGKTMLNKLLDEMKSQDYLKREKAAEMVISIARQQAGNSDITLISALSKVCVILKNTYSYTIRDKAVNVLHSLLLVRNRLFAPDELRNNSTEVISIINAIVQAQGEDFVGELAKTALYINPDNTFYSEITKSSIEALIKLGDQGRKALAGIFTPDNYQNKANILKVAVKTIVESGIWDKKIFDALSTVIVEPSVSNGKYYPDLNREAAYALIGKGDAAVEMLCGLFTGENYRYRPAQLSGLIDALIENKVINRKMAEKYLWAFSHNNPDGSRNSLIRGALINTFVKLNIREAVDQLIMSLSDSDESMREAAAKALISLKVTPDKLEPFLNSNDSKAKNLAIGILKTIAPNWKGEHTEPKKMEKKDNQPGKGMSKASKISGIAILAMLITASIILTRIFSKHEHKVKSVYNELTAYAGNNLNSNQQYDLRKIAEELAEKMNYEVDDICEVLATALPEINSAAQNKRIGKISQLISKIKKAGLNASLILKSGLPLAAAAAHNDNEFDNTIDLLADMAVALNKQGMNVYSFLDYNLKPLKDYISDFAVFKAIGDMVKELLKDKHNPQEAFTSVIPPALRTARNAHVKTERLNIILQLILRGIHPTQLLIETLEKTASGGRINTAIAQWLQMLNDFKTGAVAFDINNPFHIDLEYTTFRQLASQLSQGNSYQDYQAIIQKFRASSNSIPNLNSQELSEIKLAVYEAHRLLEFIFSIKAKADKLGYPVWVVPNLSYGKFAVAPILDELAKAKIEVHYARIGSSESHDHPELVKPGLFSDDTYSRIIRERPVIIAVDGTKHLLARPQERKSARYPDAYVGYRNFTVALDEVLSGTKDKDFQDKVKVDKDFLGILRGNSNYNALVDKLVKLNAGLDQPFPLYSLEFWNPGGLRLVVREARKEVQNASPFDPNSLESPALIFVNAPLLDEDVPVEIKKWAGLEQEHVPAFFDDRSEIQQTFFAVNGRGVYLSHALDFEVSHCANDLKSFYKDKLPQAPVSASASDSLRNMFEAMLFDVDGTLTDTLSEINKSLLDKLLYFLGSGVVVGLITSQSLDEVRKYIIDKIGNDKKQELQSFIIYTARGAQAWGFDQNKNAYSIYDRSQTDLNDAQRGLIRQVINQALGSLASDAQIIDRQPQITIRLDKSKDKRDAVGATLNQLIDNNNLPFYLDYSGESTLHVVLKGIDKGTAKDHFINHIIPERLKHSADLAKLLIVGDKFQDYGSDRPMFTKGARVVSVGKKDKTIPEDIEIYHKHGWKGTNQLLGDIIQKSSKASVTLQGIAFSLLGIFNLNAITQETSEAASKPFYYYPGIIALGAAFIFLSVTAVVKYLKVRCLYAQAKEPLTFLERKGRRELFKEVRKYMAYHRSEKPDANRILMEILPNLSRRLPDKRLIEISNSLKRLSKAEIDSEIIFKYCLPVLSSKAKGEKDFLESLNIIEQLLLLLKNKKYDYAPLIKEILPVLAQYTRNIDEFKEGLFLAIALVGAGRNPAFAITMILPEVERLTKTLPEFKIGLYVLKELCLKGFEPTKYLIGILIKQTQQNKIDQTISGWQDTLRKFKSGNIIFNPNNQLHVNLEYTTFRELVDRTLKQTRRYSYNEYLAILNNFNADKKRLKVGRREKVEIKYAAYEAFRLRNFILDVLKQAKKLNRPLWVVPNLSYGRFAVSPLLKDLAKDGVEIHYARIGSSESHDNPTLVKPDFFSAALYDRIINEQPIIIVVDGTQHLLARVSDKKSARYPDAYVGYRNLIIAVNDIISAGREQLFKGLVKSRGGFIRGLRGNADYRTLRRRLLRLYQPKAKNKHLLYNFEFWNPGGIDLVIREARKEVKRVNPVLPQEITQPALIFVNSVMLDEHIPGFIRQWAAGTKAIHHKPAYFDDTAHIQNFIFNVDNFGVSLSDALYRNIRKEYKRIKSIYHSAFTISAKPQNLSGLAYKAFISDLDGTLADTLEEVPKPIMEKLLYLLWSGVQVAIVTTQSYKEVEKYLLKAVPNKYKALLYNMTIYTATGSQGWGFDKNGDPLKAPLYDIAESHLSGQEMTKWRAIVTSLVQEYGLDKAVINKRNQTAAGQAKIIDAGSQVIIRLKERGFLRPELMKRLKAAFNTNNLPLSLKEIGRTSIRMTLKGADKSIAVRHHLSQVCKDRFGFEPKPNEVLILGNSFDEDGDDREMMIKGARIVSVGRKAASKDLRAGIDFYPVSGWQGSDNLLAEFINALSADKKSVPASMAKNTVLNSFILFPFLDTESLSPLDAFIKLLVGCAAITTAGLFKFIKDKFSFKPLMPPEEEAVEEEPEKDGSDILVEKQGAPGKELARPQEDNIEEGIDNMAKAIIRKYPGIRIGVIGAALPTKEYAPDLGKQLGGHLRAYIAEKGFIFTGGVAGVGVDVFNGVYKMAKDADDRFFVLLPQGVIPDIGYNKLSSIKKLKVEYIGEDMYERRIGIGKVADVVIVLNGGGGTLHEAISALENGKKIIVLNYGGAGALLYNMKVKNAVYPQLIKSGLKQKYLENIILADIDNIEEALDNVIGKGDFIRDLDIFGRAIFSVDKYIELTLIPQVISAINSLSASYNGLTLEVDVDTLIDTRSGMPRLKGIGFKEALGSLYKAQEKEEIPRDLRIRLINVNPGLDKLKIIKTLGLDDGLLKEFVSIPDIPPDYRVNGLEPYLEKNSIRIVYEDNAAYWGKKIDVLVKRGREDEVISSLGLIVAALAKEPAFYEGLPSEVKEYISASVDNEGRAILDDDRKIKQLIFKPIEKTRVDIRYLDRLYKENRELEAMA